MVEGRFAGKVKAMENANKKPEAANDPGQSADQPQLETLGEWVHVGDAALRAALKLNPELMGHLLASPLVGNPAAPSELGAEQLTGDSSDTLYGDGM